MFIFFSDGNQLDNCHLSNFSWKVAIVFGQLSRGSTICKVAKLQSCSSCKDVTHKCNLPPKTLVVR